jgi:hypothetical protein
LKSGQEGELHVPSSMQSTDRILWIKPPVINWSGKLFPVPMWTKIRRLTNTTNISFKSALCLMSSANRPGRWIWRPRLNCGPGRRLT